MPAAYINRDETIQPLDTLTEVPTTFIKGSGLKAGMVLVDPELNTPEAEIDHRRGQYDGTTYLFVYYFDANKWGEEKVGTNSKIKVMARGPVKA